jgi:SNF2 family DNA or RNA helicase
MGAGWLRSLQSVDGSRRYGDEAERQAVERANLDNLVVEHNSSVSIIDDSSSTGVYLCQRMNSIVEMPCTSAGVDRKGSATMQQLVQGNIVSFNGQGEYEVIEVLAYGRQVRIQPPEGEPIVVRYEPDILQRIQRRPGDPVRSLVSGVGGVVQSIAGEQDGVTLYRVQFNDGRPRVTRETDLRSVPISDPLQLLERGTVESVRDFQLRTMAARLSLAHQYDELATLSNTRLELKPHQVFVAHRVVENPPHRYLLADEVGLGKTIEAGLVLKELRARGVARRVLIITPANLTTQWQWELRNKFNEVFSLFTPETVQYLREQRPGENVWAASTSIICSAQFITAGDRVERAGPRASFAREENLPQRMQEILQTDWDLVIVDEAHHARRSSRSAHKQETNILYWFLSHLAQRSPSLLLLTATPMQLDASELYWLIDLLDPALFPSLADFEAARIQTAAINHVIGAIRRWDRPGGAGSDLSLQAELVGQVVAQLDRLGAGEWDEEMVVASLLSPASRQSILDLLARGHHLSEVIIRNRKGEVGGFMRRMPHVIPVSLSPEEADAYKAVTAYVQEGYRQSQRLHNTALGFMMVTFQKLLSSSSYALDRSLERRLLRLDEMGAEQETAPTNTLVPDMLDDEELDEGSAEGLIEEALSASTATTLATEVAIIADLRARIARITRDTKLERLCELLDTLPRAAADTGGVPTKVLVFSQFRETVRYLQQALSADFVCEVFHGSLNNAQKDEAVRRFRDPAGAQILLSTEAGGEGRNFQFCHVLVNYDLPWNPMRVEQRIGRLDRIGQRHPIQIYNFALEDTVEQRVVEVLNRRIKLFEETVGGIEPILGDVARDLRQLIMQQDFQKVEQFASQLEQRVQEARQLERQQADFVMDMRSFSPRQAQQVIDSQTVLNYEHLRAWARRALESVGCKLNKRDDRPNVYEVHANERFKTRFRQIPGLPRFVTFNRERALADEDLDFLAFGHPIIDSIIEAWLHDEHGGLAASWDLSDPAMPAFEGYLFNFIAEFSGMRRIRRLYSVAVARTGQVEAEVAEALLSRCGDYAKPTEFPPDPLPCPEIDGCFAAAEQYLQRLLTEEAGRLGERAAASFEQESTKIGRYFTYRRTMASQKIQSIGATLAGLRERDSEAVLPMWEANLEHSKKLLADLDEQERRQKQALLSRRHVRFEFSLLNAAVVSNRPGPQGAHRPAGEEGLARE